MARINTEVAMTGNANLSDYLGIGLYSFPEAARIIGVEPRLLRRWAKEYAYIDNGIARQHLPVVSRHFGTNSSTLSFLELIELLFVKTFRAEGVSMQAIRRAAERAAERFHTPYPFAVQRFDTDGKYIFATLKDEATDSELIEELGRGQFAFDRVIKPLFRRLDYQTSALRYWPREHGGRMVLDPQRAFGKPIDSETGIPTEVLYNAANAEGGQRLEDVAAWYEVPVAAVKAALDYETQVRQQIPLAA